MTTRSILKNGNVMNGTERLCRVIARHRKIYSTHMRSEFEGIRKSIGEQLELARCTGCRSEISHLPIAGRRSWRLYARVVETLEAARASGIDRSFDCYPYVARSIVLTHILPQWCLEGGAESLVARLNDSSTRARIAAETRDHLVWDWKDILISAVASETNAQWVGRDLAYIAGKTGKKPIHPLLDLLIEEHAAVNMICFKQSEENLYPISRHPLSIIISGGVYVKGRPHPRLYGTLTPSRVNTCVSRNCCRWTKRCAGRDVILRIASRTRREGKTRSRVQADVAVFDPDKIVSDSVMRLRRGC